MSLQRAKGVRDFLPEQKIARDNIIEKLKKVFEIYGYNPIETPILERYDLFASKYGVGEGSDTLKESFKLTDNGGRDLILRSEFTVPVARLVGMNKQLKMPFKRYQIGQIFRDGPLKPGRYREFWQCDVDVIGCSVGYVDRELIDMAQNIFSDLKIDVEIRISNRKLLNSILTQANVDDKRKDEAIICIDKYDKVGADGVKKELKDKKFPEDQINKIVDLISVEDKDNQEIINALREKLDDTEGLDEIELVLKASPDNKNVFFMPNLARGLGYYTGTIFEVFLKDKSKISSSVAGGGRYDKMVSGFLGEKKDYPAIGISFGLETIFDAMDIESKTEKKTVVDYYVVPISKNASNECFKLVKAMRSKKANADMDYLERPLSKALNYANSLGIKTVVILGEDEIKDDKVMVRNMSDGHQEPIDRQVFLDGLKSKKK